MKYLRVTPLALAVALSAPLLAEDAAGRLPRPDVPTEEFRVGIEDELQVVVWGEEALTMGVKVRPDGKITLPLINDIAVVGLTPEEIRQQITRRLSEFVRAPNVTVIVQAINSFRVYFLGEVRGAGARQFYRPTRLLQAIATVGGLTEFARKQITLVREIDGLEKRIPIDYKQLVAGSPEQENIYLQPGDLLLFN